MEDRISLPLSYRTGRFIFQNLDSGKNHEGKQMKESFFFNAREARESGRMCYRWNNPEDSSTKYNIIKGNAHAYSNSCQRSQSDFVKQERSFLDLKWSIQVRTST